MLRWAVVLVVHAFNCQAQFFDRVYEPSPDCQTAKPMCSHPRILFKASNETGEDDLQQIRPYVKGHSISTCADIREAQPHDEQPNAAWFYLKLANPGQASVTFRVVSNTNTVDKNGQRQTDLDYVVWGPLASNPTSFCTSTYMNVGSEVACQFVDDVSEGEFVTIPVDKQDANLPYYMMMLNDRDSVHSSFYVEPIDGSGAAGSGAGGTDCNLEGLRGPDDEYEKDLYPQTKLLSNKPVHFIFRGVLLDLRAAGTSQGDRARVVPLGDDCSTGTVIGETDDLDLEVSTRIYNVSNDTSAANAVWRDFVFSEPGDYSLCYKPFGLQWKQFDYPVIVFPDNLAVPDAPDANSLGFLRITPQEVFTTDEFELFFHGYEATNYVRLDAKIVLYTCREKEPSVPGGEMQEVDPVKRMARFTVSQPGRYRVCVRYRDAANGATGNWETVGHEESQELIGEYLYVVENTNTYETAPFQGYSSCDDFIRLAETDACGCFYKHGWPTGQAQDPVWGTDGGRYFTLPIDYPFSSILRARAEPKTRIEQGCCALGAKKMVGGGTRFSEAVDELNQNQWGWCAKPSA